MNPARGVMVLFLGLVCLNGGGCFSARAIDIEAFVMPHQVDTTAETYILQPPDEIEVHCATFERIGFLNRQRQRIRPDGKISFEELGEIKVAGKTPAEVSAILEQKARELFLLDRDHPIDARVVVFTSKVYYVVGEVSMPGPKLYTGRDSVLTAIAAANPEVTAWTDQIQVIRPSADPNERPRIFKVKYKDMIKRGDTSKNVLLEEGDIIYVPPTILASIAMVVEEIARPIGRALTPVISYQRLTMGGGYGGW